LCCKPWLGQSPDPLPVFHDQGICDLFTEHEAIIIMRTTKLHHITINPLQSFPSSITIVLEKGFRVSHGILIRLVCDLERTKKQTPINRISAQYISYLDRKWDKCSDP